MNKPFEIFDPEKQYTGEEANDIVSVQITHVYQNGEETSVEFGAWRPEPTWESSAKAEGYLIGIQFKENKKSECKHIYFNRPLAGTELQIVKWAIDNFKLCPYCGIEMEDGQPKHGKDLRGTV